MPIATLIQSGDFASQAVTTAALRDDAVTTAKVLDANVTAAKLAAQAVTAAKLHADISSGGGLSGGNGSNLSVNVDGSTLEIHTDDNLRVMQDGITANELADNAVDTAAIVDGAVQTAKIDAAAVTTAKIADGNVTEAKLGAGSVTESKIGSNAVTAAKIATDAVGSDEIAANAVGRSELDESADYVFAGDVTFSAAVTASTVPSADSHLVNKAYLDARIQGLYWKEPVNVAADSNISVSSAPASIDGYSPSAGDRILLKSQTDATENGIYVYDASGSALSRAADMNDSGEFSSAAVFVRGGSNADSAFTCTNDGAVTIGSDNVAFVQFTGTGQIVAGDGLTKTGNTVDVVPGNGLEVAADELNLDLYASGGLSATQGDGGELGILADQGIEVDADGVAVKIAGGSPCLEFDGVDDGLKVVADNTKAIQLSGTGLQVRVRAAGAVEIDNGELDVKDGSIDNARLGADAVDQSKIADDAIQPEHLHDDTLALMKGYTQKLAGTATNGSADITFTPTGSFPTLMPGHLFFLNGRLMDLGSGLDYTVADNGDGTFTITLEQNAVSGDRYVIIYDNN